MDDDLLRIALDARTHAAWCIAREDVGPEQVADAAKVADAAESAVRASLARVRAVVEEAGPYAVDCDVDENYLGIAFRALTDEDWRLLGMDP